MADQTEELDNPIGPGISELDTPRKTRPVHLEGLGEADNLVTEEDADEPEQHNTPLPTDRTNAPEDVTRQDENEPAPHNEPLGVLSDNIYIPEDTDDMPPESGFSSSSGDDDEDADDERAKQGDDDDIDRTANRESPTFNHGLWEPHQEPYRPVLGFRGNDDVFRPGCYGVSNLHPERYSQIFDPEERKRLKEAFSATRLRPSLLRIASSPDSPVSPKKTQPTADDVGILPEPSPQFHYDESPVSPLSDHELPLRPQNPTLPELPHNITRRSWSEYDDSDDSWIEDEIEKLTGSRRGSQSSLEQILTADQTPADGGDEALSDQQRSPVSPIDPVSPNDPTSPVDPVRETENRMVVYGSNLPEEISDNAEASEDDVQMPQQTDTAPKSFEPISVGAEKHDDAERETSPTSPDFFGPEPLTGKTPQEGIDAWWAWREKNRPARKAFRTNRNPGNEDKTGDLRPTTSKDDAVTFEAQRYLAAQRLDVKQLVNMQQGDLQAMARQSHQISEAIKFDLESALEYVKLRMLKYRFERNKYYEEAAYNHEKVGRREEQLDHMTAELHQAEQGARQYINELNIKLWETERAYKQIMEEKASWEPILQEKKDKRKQLKAQYQAQAEMSEAYQKAAQSSGNDLRSLRARFAKMAASLQFSPIQAVSQEPGQATKEKPRQLKRAAPLQFAPIVKVISQAPVQPKQPTPLQPSSSMETSSREPVTDTSQEPQSNTNDESQSNANDEPKPDTSEKTESGVSKQAKYAKYSQLITPQQFESIMDVFSWKFVSGTNQKSKRTKQGKRAAPRRLSPFTSFVDFGSQGSSSDTGRHPKSAPPTYNSRRGPPPPFSPFSPDSPGSFPRPRGPAPEHEANWPLEVRPAVVDFMTKWINKHRETRQPNDAPNPLQKAQLDKILGVGFLSWNQLIKELFKLGYTIRRDHLAQALADPKNVFAYGLPMPNTAVLYEARRLKRHNAVKELMEEVVELKRQLDNLRMPYEFTEDLRHMKSQKAHFEKEAKDLNAELDDTWEEIERLRKTLSNSAGITDFGSQADRKEISRLKDAYAASRAELEETQQTLAEVMVDIIHPDSPPSHAAPGSTAVLDRLAGMLHNREMRDQELNAKLSLENGELTEKLDAMRSDCDEFARELSNSRAKYTSLYKTSNEKIANLEEKLAAGDSSRTGDAKSPSSIEDALKMPLPAASKPAQSQQLPAPTETETEIQTTTQTRVPHPLPAVRERVPLPEEQPVPPEARMSEAQVVSRTAMHHSATYIADANRRRAIREQYMAARRERTMLICRRAAAIFGEEDLPYVPVAERYKPMVRT